MVGAQLAALLWFYMWLVMLGGRHGPAVVRPLGAATRGHRSSNVTRLPCQAASIAQRPATTATQLASRRGRKHTSRAPQLFTVEGNIKDVKATNVQFLAG